MRRDRKKKRKLLNKKVFILVFLLFAFAIIFVKTTFSQLFTKKYQLEDEIIKYEEEITYLEDTNDELKRLIEYLKTPDYARTQARNKLGVKMPGEEVVVITEPTATFVEYDENTFDSSSIALKDSPNPKLWWNYFFGEK